MGKKSSSDTEEKTPKIGRKTANLGAGGAEAEKTGPTPTPQPPPKTPNPTKNPTNDPTSDPTIDPTSDPTNMPTSPTSEPTTDPTTEPTAEPTRFPTVEPTLEPTDPSKSPTFGPSQSPTIAPTGSPFGSFNADPETPEPTITQADDGGNNLLGGDNANGDSLTIMISVVFGALFCATLVILLVYCAHTRRKTKQLDGINVNVAMYERGDRVPGSSPVEMDGNPTTFSMKMEGNQTQTGDVDHVVNDDVFKHNHEENQDLYVVPPSNVSSNVTRKYSDSDESAGVYDRVTSITVGSDKGLPPVNMGNSDEDDSDDQDAMYRKDRSTNKV